MQHWVFRGSGGRVMELGDEWKVEDVHSERKVIKIEGEALGVVEKSL